jgi:hypothetical protein
MGSGAKASHSASQVPRFASIDLDDPAAPKPPLVPASFGVSRLRSAFTLHAFNARQTVLTVDLNNGAPALIRVVVALLANGSSVAHSTSTWTVEVVPGRCTSTLVAGDAHDLDFVLVGKTLELRLMSGNQALAGIVDVEMHQLQSIP